MTEEPEPPWDARQVVSTRSIFQLGSYWGAYVLAWIPFVVLVVVGLMLQRRIRTRSRQLRIYGETVAVGAKSVQMEQQAPGRESDR